MKVFAFKIERCGKLSFPTHIGGDLLHGIEFFRPRHGNTLVAVRVIDRQIDRNDRPAVLDSADLDRQPFAVDPRRPRYGRMRSYCRRFFVQQFKRSASADGPAVMGFTLSPRDGHKMPSDASNALWLEAVENLE